MTEMQKAIFRALDFALAVDGKRIGGIEQKMPLPGGLDRESGAGETDADARLSKIS